MRGLARLRDGGQLVRKGVGAVSYVRGYFDDVAT